MKKTFAVNLALPVLLILYIILRFQYLNTEIPLWLAKTWGAHQLESKDWIYLIPICGITITVLGYLFSMYVKNKHLRYGPEMFAALVTICNSLLFLSGIRIIEKASRPFPPLLNPNYVKLLLPMAIAGLISYIIAPYIIDKLKEHEIVTDPNLHKHPGMLLTKPSVRGGALIFTVGVLLSSILFVTYTPIVKGLILAMVLSAILGFLDDFQNAKPNTFLSKLENPTVRFLLQALVILPIIFAGVQIMSVNNPFDGVLKLDQLHFTLNNLNIYPLAIGLTLVWLLWIINLLSWSNGVDGQYTGIVTISAIVIALITLRESNLNFDQRNMVNFAALVAGASLGLLPYTWHPSKVLWGFGAISAGLALGTLSILTQAKIATSLIVLAVPFLDGAITVIRRIIQKKSPLKGDRGHLHHLLLNMGWSVKKVAVFYWVATAVTGFIGIKSADKNLTLSALVAAGIVAFIIIAVNVSQFGKKRQN